MMEEIVRRPIIFIEGGQAFKLACHDGVTSVEHQPEICSSHEEADVSTNIYIKYIQTTMSHIKDHQGQSKGLKELINISQLVDNYSQEHIAAMLAFLYTYLLQLVSCGRLMMITLSMASRYLRVAFMGLDRE